MPAALDDEGTVRTTVSIPKADYEEVERIAREKRVSVAWVVREALAEYLVEPASESDKKKNRGGRGR
jgi:metal-responsive CopG/Arc/MetJ family transcriptional regulator